MTSLFRTSGPMHDFVLGLIFAVGGIFLALLVIIIAGKAWREIVEARRRRRRAELEPSIFRYLTGSGPIEQHLPRPLRRGDRAVVEEVLFDLGRVVKGAVHERAREAFERLGFVDHYLRRLGKRRWWARAEAAEKLGLIGSQQAARPLIAALQDPVPEVRVRAARALGSIRTSEALEALVQTLRDPGRWSAIRVSGILIEAGDQAVACLMSEFDRLPLHARIAAVDIFGRIRSLKATPLLLYLLMNPEDDLRARAAFALGSIGDPNTAPFLMEALKDRAWPARAMAAKALGRLREYGSIPALCAALGDPQWWVRANAAEALRNKGDIGTRSLIRMLDSGDPYAAQQAVQMLQEAGVLDSMIAQLASRDGAKRQQALDVMAKLVVLRRVDLLTEMAHNHPDASIRQRLAIVLGLRVPREQAAV